MPSEFGLLSRLESLSLRDNLLTSTIPSEVGLLRDLETLDLQNNTEMSGSIPLELCDRINNGVLLVNFSGSNIRNSCQTVVGTLFDLYYSTSGDAWYYKSDWLSSTVSWCEWYRIICAENTETIIQINLYFNELRGSIPASISTLSSLDVLDLHDNTLTGTIPTEVGLLSSLQYLVLDANTLTGTIPTEVGLLSTLQRLYLHENLLSSIIPPEVGLLSSVQRLYLNENLLTGTIPTEVGIHSNGKLLHKHCKRHKISFAFYIFFSVKPG